MKPAQLQFCVATLGTERIVYSVDYRFVGNEGAAEFLAAAEFSDDANEAVAHGTAEPLLAFNRYPGETDTACSTSRTRFRAWVSFRCAVTT